MISEANVYRFLLETMHAADPSNAATPPFGTRFKHMMRSSVMRDRLAGVSMIGEDLPYATNRVDLDPTVRRHFPHGYRDFNYLVATQVMRALAYQVPQTKQALQEEIAMTADRSTKQRTLASVLTLLLLVATCIALAPHPSLAAGLGQTCGIAGIHLRSSLCR